MSVNEMSSEDFMQILRNLLNVVDSDAEVMEVDQAAICANGIYHVRTADGVRDPTHAVFDADGNVLGRGIGEGRAIADAIASRFVEVQEDLDELRSKIRNFQQAGKSLGILS